MKKEFYSPEVATIKFQSTDIITSSVPNNQEEDPTRVPVDLTGKTDMPD